MRLILALAAILFTSALSPAHTAPELPVFYLWGQPQSYTGQGREFNLNKMVIVNIVQAGSAYDAAKATKQAIQDQIAAGHSDKDHICIVLLNQV